MARKVARITDDLIEQYEKQMDESKKRTNGKSAEGELIVDVVVNVTFDESKKELKVTKRPLHFKDGKLVWLGDLKPSRIKLDR